MRLDGVLLRKILRLGIPAAIGMVVMSLAELCCSASSTASAPAPLRPMARSTSHDYVQFRRCRLRSRSRSWRQAIGRGNADRLGSIVRTGLLMKLV